MFPSECNPAEYTEPLDPPQRQVQIQANQLVAHGKPGQAATAECENCGSLIRPLFSYGL